MKAKKIFKKAVCFVLVLSLSIPVANMNADNVKEVKASESSTAKPLKYKYESAELNLTWGSVYTFKLPWGAKKIKSVKYASKIWEENDCKMIKQTSAYKSVVSYKVLGKRKIQFAVGNKQDAKNKNLPLSDNGNLRNGIMVVLKLKGDKKYRIRINPVEEGERESEGVDGSTINISAKNAVTDEEFKKRSTKPKAVSSLSSPSGLKVYTSITGSMLDWQKVDNAIYYDVYRKSKNSKWKKIGKVKESDYIYRDETVRQFVDIRETGYKFNKSYDYKVIAVNRKTTSKASTVHAKKHKKQKVEMCYDALYWTNYYKKKYAGMYFSTTVWSHESEAATKAQSKENTKIGGHADPVKKWWLTGIKNPSTGLYASDSLEGLRKESWSFDGLEYKKNQTRTSKWNVYDLYHSAAHRRYTYDEFGAKFSNTTWCGGDYGRGNIECYHNENNFSETVKKYSLYICDCIESKSPDDILFASWFYPENTWSIDTEQICVAMEHDAFVSYEIIQKS